MNQRVVVALGLTALVALAFWLFSGGSEAEEQVEKALREVVQAIEIGDETGLELAIATDYSDRMGHDQEAVIRRILDEVEHYEGLTIVLDDLEIEVEEESGFATAVFVPRYEGTPDESRKTRPKYRFKPGQSLQVKFRRHGTTWLVVRGGMRYSITGALGGE